MLEKIPWNATQMPQVNVWVAEGLTEAAAKENGMLFMHYLKETARVFEAVIPEDFCGKL